MTAYLLQWNPIEYLPRHVRRNFKQGKFTWSFASYRSAKIGDKIFLRRSGKNRPGIVTVGTIVGFTEPTESWYGSTERPAVIVKLDVAADVDGQPLVSDEVLLAIPDQAWRSQSSVKSPHRPPVSPMEGGCCACPVCATLPG